MMKRLLIIAALLVLAPTLAYAQGTPVITNPALINSSDQSATITATNTFQTVFPVPTGSAGRKGCLIQNGGSNAMFVYVHQGTSGVAAKSHSYQIIAPGTGIQGGTFSCASLGGGILQDQIDITGTIGDTFTATSQ